MLEHLIDLVGRLGHWGYLIIFISVTLECAALFFLPGESLVLIGGFFAARGQLDLGTLIVVVAAGAILGYCIGFEIGRRFGRAELLHFGRWIGLRESHFNLFDAFFARCGGATVFIGRFTLFLRAFGSLMAGSSRMPYGRFFFFNALGAIIWSITFTLLGYFVGASWEAVERWIGRADVFVIIALILVAIVAWFRHWKK